MSLGASPSRTNDTYEEAVKLLASRRRLARPTTSFSNKTGGDEMPQVATFTGTPSLSNMRTWLQALGHNAADLERLNVIHVAGTKGKGSTCAFTASFLKAHGHRTGYPKKVGLYTSPHLQELQERIQIDSQPVQRDLFTKYVFDVWRLLDASDLPKPRYLQLLMLVAVHTFISEQVDVFICETHHGGEFDATNIFVHPIATGIATIGMDHVMQLGPSIENIAWHKAGIFKSGTPAFSVGQGPQITSVLQRRADEKSVKLEFIDEDIVKNDGARALETRIQRKNASLAKKLADAFLLKKKPLSNEGLTPQDIQNGATDLRWYGRFQQIVLGQHRWFLDGAHNEMSVPYSAQWFAEILARDLEKLGSLPRVLVFSHMSERDGAAMLRSIAKTLREHDVLIDQLIISTYEERRDGSMAIERCRARTSRPFPKEVQERYIEAWREYQPDAKVFVELTVEGALSLARSADRGAGMSTLVTGSLYLVGSALQLLKQM